MKRFAGMLAQKIGIKQEMVQCYERLYDRIRTIQMYILKPLDDAWNKQNGLNVMSIEETIKYIIKNECSVARFGDGEFNIVSGKGIGFQSQNNQLTIELKKILNEAKKVEGICLVALPGIFRNENDYEPSTRRFWKKILVHKRKQWYKECDSNYTYGNADITRCYIELEDKTHSMEYFMQLKGIWNQRNVVIVEGEKSRLGVGNDLFDNCRSIKRILCPPLNAFDVYDKILDFIENSIDKESLLLLALGPTATVLAVELSRCGYQAIDIGNIDKEYEWCISNATSKVINPIKFTLEIPGGSEVVDCCNEEYVSSIIQVIE